MHKLNMVREAIINRMKELKVTQIQMAGDLNLSRPNLSNFLTGKRPFPLPDIEKILKYLNLEIKPKQEVAK